MKQQQQEEQQGADTRRKAVSRSNVAAGSVWETRMKMDLVKGGIKVFTAHHNKDEEEEEVEGIKLYSKLQTIQSDGVNPNLSPKPNAERRKKRNWKTPKPAAAGDGKNPIHLLKARSDLSFDDEIKIEGDGKCFDDKEIDLPPVVEDEKKIHEIEMAPISLLKNDEPELEREIVKPNSIELEGEEIFEKLPESETPKRMQSIFDLVMWRDISRSAFVFGAGTFILLSSSYTKDLNFSLISATAYLALFYLALIFIYKSILGRGAVEFDEGVDTCVIGEEEAIRALRYLLPYINEVMLKFKTLFSGDPVTTMKLAVVLFVTARCGSSITAWTLVKIAFFGVFTIPKVLSSYSLVLARYGR